MHPSTTATLLTLLTALTSASPLAAAIPSSINLPNPSPSLSPNSPKASAALNHEIASLIASPSSSASITKQNPQPQSCPAAHASKQCCTSVTGLADEVIGENGLGDVIPWLEGVQVSSLVGFECMSMGSQGNENCLESVMCCSGSEANPGATEPGKQSLFKSGCVAFDKAVADAGEEGQTEAPLASSSAAPSASASASSRLGRA
ncbi:uncharacterized protein BDV14DRAFT_77210 [Aspergillus stella-maris]|uniref:uncharacterized protein n=1 Tax=Aspergillus stella-maris TaxID=1810926 RepID=UPI003CCDE7A0